MPVLRDKCENRVSKVTGLPSPRGCIHSRAQVHSPPQCGVEHGLCGCVQWPAMEGKMFVLRPFPLPSHASEHDLLGLLVGQWDA